MGLNTSFFSRILSKCDVILTFAVEIDCFKDMKKQKITDRVYYVGVNDRTTTRFEGLWPLPKGVSYNSYVVKGSRHIAIVEGVEASFVSRQIESIKAVCDGKSPDFLIVNHMEPDHSGAIRMLMLEFPQMVIVGNAKTLEMLEGYYGINDHVLSVADGDTLSLGDCTLKFSLTPMVHWPETMMTHLIEDAVLFSGDAFGCFGALNGGIIDSEMLTDGFFPEMTRYYSNIVGKYGKPVQKALEKYAATKIDFICSTHGPVWHDRVADVVEAYDRMSRYEAKEGVTIVYGSMYGHTEVLAEKMARALTLKGVKDIRMHNLSYSDISDVLRDVFDVKGLVIATPTYNGALFPKVEAFLQAVASRGLEKRVVARLGESTWAGVGTRKIDEYLAKMKLTVVSDAIEVKQNRMADIDETLDAIAADLVAAM